MATENESAPKTTLYVFGFNTKDTRSEHLTYTTDKELADKMLAYYHKREDELDAHRVALDVLKKEYPEWESYSIGIDPQMAMFMEQAMEDRRFGGYFPHPSMMRGRGGYGGGMDYLKSLTGKKEFEEKFIALNIPHQALTRLSEHRIKYEYYRFELEVPACDPTLDVTVAYPDGNPRPIPAERIPVLVDQHYDTVRKFAVEHNKTVDTKAHSAKEVTEIRKTLPNYINNYLVENGKEAVDKAELKKLTDQMLRNIPAFVEIEKESKTKLHDTTKYNIFQINPLKEADIAEMTAATA